MKSISFILHFIIVLCMPSVVWAGGVSSVADSLYRKAEKEQSFAAYSEVLDYMIGEGETGSIYDNSLRRLQKLSEGTKDVGRKLPCFAIRHIHTRRAVLIFSAI